MKLEIKNFGPIHLAEFDLSKDYTLVVGQNNIGKSYAISLIYALIKTFLLFRRPQYPFLNDYQQSVPSEELKSWLAPMKAEFDAGNEVDITSKFNGLLNDLISINLLPALQQTLEGTFSDLQNLQNRRTAEPLSIKLYNEIYCIIFGLEDGHLVLRDAGKPGHSYYSKRIRQNRTPRFERGYTLIYSREGDDDHFINQAISTVWTVFISISEAVTGSVYDQHYLPASRSGLYQSLSAFGQIFAELAKNRTAIRNKIEIPGIAEPLGDYYLKLSDIRIQKTTNESGEDFVRVAEKIENEILQGTVEFQEKTKQLLFKPNGIEGLVLDLSATSSMVSEISPIASYLKYILPRSASSAVSRRLLARKKIATQLIILEEPEAHLHPSVQVMLLENLSSLVAGGRTKIIITSHSNYIFNKCSNLLMSGKISKPNFQAILFSSGTAGSHTTSLNVSEFGIEDENFLDTAEQIYEERREIIEKM